MHRHKVINHLYHKINFLKSIKMKTFSNLLPSDVTGDDFMERIGEVLDMEDCFNFST